MESFSCIAFPLCLVTFYLPSALRVPCFYLFAETCGETSFIWRLQWDLLYDDIDQSPYWLRPYVPGTLDTL